MLVAAAGSPSQTGPGPVNKPRPRSDEVPQQFHPSGPPGYAEPEYPRTMGPGQGPRPINMQHPAQSSPALTGE